MIDCVQGARFCNRSNVRRYGASIFGGGPIAKDIDADVGEGDSRDEGALRSGSLTCHSEQIDHDDREIFIGIKRYCR